MSKVVNPPKVVFTREADTKRKAKYGSPDGANVQGVLYIAKESVPDGHDVEVTVKFVPQED